MADWKAAYVYDVLGWDPDHIAMVQALPDISLLQYLPCTAMTWAEQHRIMKNGMIMLATQLLVFH
jgi:hypothetical protein